MGYNSNDDANTEEKKILGAEKKNYNIKDFKPYPDKIMEPDWL